MKKMAKDQPIIVLTRCEKQILDTDTIGENPTDVYGWQQPFHDRFTPSGFSLDSTIRASMKRVNLSHQHDLKEYISKHSSEMNLIYDRMYIRWQGCAPTDIKYISILTTAWNINYAFCDDITINLTCQSMLFGTLNLYRVESGVNKFQLVMKLHVQLEKIGQKRVSKEKSINWQIISSPIVCYLSP